MKMLKAAILVGAAAILASVGFHPQEAGPLSAQPTSGGNPLGLTLHASAPDRSPVNVQASATGCRVTADCDFASPVSCIDSTSPFSCLGRNQDCDAQIRGYVQCNGGFKRYCPPLSQCPIEAPPCSELNGQSCSPNGSTRDCTALGLTINNGCLCENNEWQCISEGL